MMAEVDEALTRYGATTADLLDVADRLLTSAFANIAPQLPESEAMSLADKTLRLIRHHIAHRIRQTPPPQGEA